MIVIVVQSILPFFFTKWHALESIIYIISVIQQQNTSCANNHTRFTVTREYDKYFKLFV